MGLPVAPAIRFHLTLGAIGLYAALVSTYVFMKVLESAPHRYDAGIRRLSGGRIDEIYHRVAALAVEPGSRTLDIGCGTGGVTLACAALGARVVGIDSSAEMLQVARQKEVPAENGGTVEWLEIGVAEMVDHFEKGSLDAVVSCLCFSELSPDERTYTLQTAKSLLAPGGRIVIADEVLPDSNASRLWHRLRRLPSVVTTYVATQTTTRPVEGLREAMEQAGFEGVAEEHVGADFAIYSAKVGGEG